VIWPPRPHPLDFDWRYNEATARTLMSLLRGEGPLLAIGAPSVARLLQRAGVDITLLDRQPEQGVEGQVACDASEFVPDRFYRTALVDPPWYPAQLINWSKTAARAVGVGGTVFVSIWPVETRPTASSELSALFDDLSTWAGIWRNQAVVQYEMPHFESVARQHGDRGELSRSPLVGELIRLRITRVPTVVPSFDLTDMWRRFTVDDYQLAVRCRLGDRSGSVDQIPSADGWLWPFVSARAPDLGLIDLWSSEGEVAALGSPKQIIETLRLAFSRPDSCSFQRALAGAAALLDWRIPRPPYRRLVEWHHRQ
jgi:hypothetical protein